MRIQQRLKYIYNPDWLINLDSYLLLNYPRLWVIKLHYVFYYGLLVNIVLFSLVWIAIKPHQLDEFINLIIPIVIIAELFIFISWSIKQVQFNIEKDFGNIDYISNFLEILFYLICSLIIISPSFFMTASSIDRVARLVKIDKDTNCIQYALNEPEAVWFISAKVKERAQLQLIQKEIKQIEKDREYIIEKFTKMLGYKPEESTKIKKSISDIKTKLINIQQKNQNVHEIIEGLTTKIHIVSLERKLSTIETLEREIERLRTERKSELLVHLVSEVDQLGRFYIIKKINNFCRHIKSFNDNQTEKYTEGISLYYSIHFVLCILLNIFGILLLILTKYDRKITFFDSILFALIVLIIFTVPSFLITELSFSLDFFHLEFWGIDDDSEIILIFSFSLITLIMLWQSIIIIYAKIYNSFSYLNAMALPITIYIFIFMIGSFIDDYSSTDIARFLIISFIPYLFIYPLHKKILVRALSLPKK